MYNIENIKSDFINHRINKNETIKLLISIIENIADKDFGSEISDIRDYFEKIDFQVDVIKVFRKLNLKNDDIYAILENLAISENNIRIKMITIREIAELFPEKSRAFLKWIFENDPLFKYMYKNWSIAIIYDSLSSTYNRNFEKVQKRLEKIIKPKKEAYVLEGVNKDEARILTIFELQTRYKLIKAVNEDIKTVGGFWHYKLNKEGHVSEINMHFKFPNYFIPKHIYLLPFLETFVFKGGGIGKIPKSIRKLEKLKLLDLSFNYIKDIPRSLSLPESLEELYLCNNYLKSIPDPILNLRNLKNLDLSTNLLELLPNTFKNAKNLITINLKENHISNIPESLRELKSITQINLRDNPIKELPLYFNNSEWSSKIIINS